MELDELRQRWQQVPPPAATNLDETALHQLLAKRSMGLIEKMRRNTWVEIAFTALIVIALPFYIATRSSTFHRMYGTAMLLLALPMLYYYYRQMQLLGRMTQAEVHVRAHLRALSTGLRRLLHFYYRLTLASGPYALLLGLRYYVGRELARNGPFRWELMAWTAAAVLVFGVLLQVGVVYGTRWYLQKLYGQHLDRLEQSLAELEEPAPGLLR